MSEADDLLEAIGRRPGESTKSWQALVEFCKAGRSRSLSQLSRTDGAPSKSRRVIQRWATRFDWWGRAAAWDLKAEEQRTQRWLERAEQAREAEWRDAQDARMAARAHLVRLRDDPDVTLGAVVTALKTAAELERLATGEPTSITQLTGGALDLAIAAEYARLYPGKAGAAAGDAQAANAGSTPA